MKMRINHRIEELFYAEGDELFAKDPYVNGMRLAYYHETVLWKEIVDLREKLEKAEARLKPIEEVADKMGKFLIKQTDDCQNDADCVCPEMNILIEEWQAIKMV